MAKPKASKKIPATSKVSAPPAAHEDVATDDGAVEGLRQWYALHLPDAQKVDAQRVTPFTGDASLAHHNARVGLGAVLAQRQAVEASGLKVDWATLETIPNVALALVYAVQQAAPGSTRNAKLQGLLKEGWKLRDLLLSAADPLEKVGVFKTKDVADIRKGRGRFDMAGDLVALADLYAKHAKDVKGKTPVTNAHVKDAARVGGELVALLKPKGARKEKSKDGADARRARDQLAALLDQRYEMLERVAGAIWGRALGEHVPALQSRVRGAKKKAAKTGGEGEGGVKPPADR